MNVQTGLISCQILIDTDQVGRTRAGQPTRGSVMSLSILARKSLANKPKSSVAKAVANALNAWGDGDATALDAVGVTLQGTDFQIAVLKAMRKIHYGTTSSYLELAHKSGFPHAHRAVASVCAKNRIPLIIPCHRVIKSDGSLGNYYYGSDLKRAILAFESH